jgi:hypothetical protein
MSGGVFVGWDLDNWSTVEVDAGFIATGIGAYWPGPRAWLSGLELDADALSGVPATASDPAVVAAVDAAFAAAGFTPRAWATAGNVEFDSYGALTSLAVSVGDSSYAGGLILTSTLGGSPVILEPAMFTSSDPSVMTVTQTGDNFTLAFLAPGSCDLVAVFRSAAAPLLGQTIPVVVT